MNFTFNQLDIFYLSPMIALFITSLIPLLAKVINKNKEINFFVNIYLPVAGCVVAAILSLLVFNNLSASHDSVFIFSNALVIDGISTFMTLIVCAISAFTIILSKENTAINKTQLSEFVFLLLNASIGMLTVIQANDLMVLFIGIEMMSLCLYILIAMSLEVRLSKEAAIKYFVLGSVASAILIYGIAFIFGATGTTYLPELAQKISIGVLTSNYLLIGICLFVLGLAFKVSLFPFYSWTPDVYQGASTPLVAYMATGVKLACFIAILRFVATNFLTHIEASAIVNVLQWLAVLTILVGNIAAIKQNNLKRMLAYSSVAHSGYILIGIVSMASPAGAELGARAVVFYLVSYAVTTFGAVALLSVFEKNENQPIDFDGLKGLARRNPYLALMFTLLMLSLAGIPPTIGFFGKFYLFSAAISQGFYWLAVWGVLGSVVSVYFYLRPLVVMYMSDEAGEEVSLGHFGTKATVLVSTVLVVAVGLVSSPLYSYISNSVKALF